MQFVVQNTYEKSYKKPSIKANGKGKIIEKLAKKIVNKGILRIAADDSYNFVKFPFANGKNFVAFSKRQLYKENLLPQTKERIFQNLSFSEKRNATASINYKLSLMREEVNKYMEIPLEHELSLARLIAQSAHPVIIDNLIEEQAEIFISYRNSISDLLDVKSWQDSHSNQGMQSTDMSHEVAIFVSAGGNPFFDPKESNNDYDGEKALIRLSIIAAQEIAHYADLIKDADGRNIGRFSTDLGMRRPNHVCENARQKDIKTTTAIGDILNKCGIEKVYKLENLFKAKQEYRKYKIDYFMTYFSLKIRQLFFIKKLELKGLHFVSKMNDKNFIASELALMVGDMLFNLQPRADAYYSDIPDNQKAIMCAEALARVPQQEIKWGEKAVKFFTPNLHQYYYNNVISEEFTYRKNLKKIKKKIEA